MTGTLVFSLLLAAAPLSGAPMPGQPSAITERNANPETLAFFAERNAQADVDRALADAQKSGTTVLVILGANWCHDSVGLAGWLDTPRFMDMMRDRFSIVYVDVGTPQIGKGRNLDIARRFGIKKVKNTPLVMAISADGILLNSKKDAIGWRNAASRNEEDIYRYFATFKPAS
ncbi:thioredoxin family protein [Sphingorhabdus sp.]|uniref:thioredoxin family protein n=1 Tax=Sphingorhabdus sp. TaxID=1902408 RepID=UPI0035946808